MIVEDDNGKQVCVCSICGHSWYPRRNKEPWKCPSMECQSTKWNDDMTIITQLDLYKRLDELKNKGDDGMDSDVVDSKVRKTIEQMKHEENLNRSLHETNQRLKSLEERFGELEECPSCHRGVPSNARRCSFCDAEYEQGDE